MPRPRRHAPPDSVHHIVNRGNDRRLLFSSADDFNGFLELTAQVKLDSGVRIIAYCLMPNHWHMMLWPERRWAISDFLHRLCTTHAKLIRRTTSTVGEGHIYQDRYRASLIESEAYYFHAIRYVEANPLRAGLVRRARDWEWSSLAERLGESAIGLVDDGPLSLPETWTTLVEDSLPEAVITTLRKPPTSRRDSRPQGAGPSKD